MFWQSLTFGALGLRFLDATRSVSTQKGARAIAATVLAGLAGPLLAGLIGAGGEGRVLAGEPGKAQTAERGSASAPTAAALTARGRVADGEGKPAFGVDPRQNPAREVPITGRIVDLAGKPVPGAEVRLVSYATARTGNLSGWIEAVRGGQMSGVATGQHRHPFKKPSGVPRIVTTGAAGRFRLDGLPAEAVVHLVLEGPSIATVMFTVVTRPIEPFRAPGFPTHLGPLREWATETIYGCDFTYRAEPSRSIEGVIHDAKSQEPVALSTVLCNVVLITDGVVRAPVMTITDDAGQFRLRGVPSQGVHPDRAGEEDPIVLTVLPDVDKPYFARRSRCRAHRESGRSRWQPICIGGSGSPARSQTRRALGRSQVLTWHTTRSGTTRSLWPPRNSTGTAPSRASLTSAGPRRRLTAPTA